MREKEGGKEQEGGEREGIVTKEGRRERLKQISLLRVTSGARIDIIRRSPIVLP